LLAALHAERLARHGRPPDAAGGAAPGPASGSEARAAGAAPPAVSLLTWNLWCVTLAAGPRLCLLGPVDVCAPRACTDGRPVRMSAYPVSRRASRHSSRVPLVGFGPRPTPPLQPGAQVCGGGGAGGAHGGGRARDRRPGRRPGRLPHLRLLPGAPRQGANARSSAAALSSGRGGARCGRALAAGVELAARSSTGSGHARPALCSAGSGMRGRAACRGSPRMRRPADRPVLMRCRTHAASPA